MLLLLPFGAMTQDGSTAVRVVGWISLCVAWGCALAIVADIARGYRQHMAIMNLVWPITALYWGPVALWGYWSRGRRMSHRWMDEHDVEMSDLTPSSDDDPPSFVPFAKRNWWPISKGVSHCGAGCTLGDIMGEWLVFKLGLTIGAFATHKVDVLVTNFIIDFGLAWAFGIAFQYFSIVPMREDVGKLAGIWQAIKADTLSIVSFQIGLFGYMALYHLAFWHPPLSVASPAYWWQMQIGMVVGYFTAWPVNTWLVKRGWKEKM
jgi:hypothetical protein